MKQGRTFWLNRIDPEKRFLMFSRSSYIGMHRYGGIWMGDNKSWWSHILRYEIIAGHRRQRASELAGFANMPCIVRNMTDDEAILAMTDDNLRHRERILPTEKAQSLKMQVEAIKHQGSRPGEEDKDAGKRSTQVVGDRNGMNYKQVQRYIRLTELVPDLQKMVDEKKLAFTPAVVWA